MKDVSISHRISPVAEILLPAVSTLFGLQLLRVMIPQIVWILGDRFSLSATWLGLIALAVFLSAYIAGPLRNLSGTYRVSLWTAGGLGLARLLVQVSWSEPLITMIICMTGVVLFGLFVSSYTDEMRFRGSQTTGCLITGFLTGLILDTAIHGFSGTYDIVWQSGAVPLLVTVILVIIQWSLLFCLGYKKHVSTETRGITWPWLAVGPFLFLQMVVLQNVARYSVATGWELPYAFGWILLSQIAGLCAVIVILRSNLRNFLPVSLVCGIILVAGTVFPYPGNPWLTAVLLLLEQISASVLIASILRTTILKTTRSRKSSVSVPGGTGLLLMGILALAYYTVYQINLPYENTVIEPIAAGILALCAVIPGLKKSSHVSAPIKMPWIIPWLTLVLLVLPLIGIITLDEPQSVQGNGYPVKVMTYNLHCGINPYGDLDMEALAQEIENENPDIVALQEISRGWLIGGRVDMLDWLSKRLGMPCIFGPTEGELWGNAVLSRFPVTESVNYKLPPEILFLERGYLVTKIDIGNNETITFIATHLHHLTEDSEVRQDQVPVLLEGWDNTPFTVITGDMNARPDTPEIALFRDAGLTDIMADVIPPEGYTFISTDPYERIDYIWITPDLVAANAHVISTQASDHMPIVVELSR
ncbi:MAG: endonuclease/exonuclease/phosphatase family protein [Dehalococcoidales bacterium]|nr:endonuclease/exonuclease/phosphatase family protein [Dehalococcoidales bacterium]